MQLAEMVVNLLQCPITLYREACPLHFAVQSHRGLTNLAYTFVEGYSRFKKRFVVIYGV